MADKEFVLADSGEREEHATGAHRDIRRGKGRFDLITPVAQRRLARVYETGAEKYEPRNWEKGFPLSRLLDSAKRHINDYEMIALWSREGLDPATLPPDVNPHEDHLTQAVWNLVAMIHHEEVNPHLDDLNHKPTPKVERRNAFPVKHGDTIAFVKPEPVQEAPSNESEARSILARLFHKAA
jgi:hypothetical protein